MTRSALLLLADSRLPAGGHAHSGGLEEAVVAGRVTSVADLALFLHGRLATAGLVAASFAAAARHAAGAADVDVDRLADLDAEYDARTPSPALRKASRAQGRALLRAGRAMWPLPTGTRPDVWPGSAGAHHAVVLGVVASGAGLTPADAALVAAHGAVTGPASAAVRLLGLDPYAVQAVLAGLATDCDATAARATGLGLSGRLPAATAPLLDIGAEDHARWEVRLFAS
jgi:urease accessory protein